MATSNNITVQNTLKLARTQIFESLVRKCFAIGIELIRYAIKTKRFSGFTGNTQTSFAIGVYFDGQLRAYETGESFQRAPLRRKIRFGKTVYLRRPYEGRSRVVRGSVETTNEFGAETSVRFLKMFKPRITKGVSMCMTVGTEYAEYIALRTGASVLSDARLRSEELVWHTIIQKPPIISI